MPELITITDESTIADVLAGLHTCSRYPHSDARTRSCDELLDLMLEWAGV